MVALARSLCEDVEFSPEDAGRSDPEFLYQVLAAAIEAGATTLNIPDTVGYTTPEEFGALIAGIRANVPGADRVIISAHCHNDLGLATANTLAAVQNGARQVEVTVNGIGERAGNTSLEEVVMALHTRPQVYGVRTNIDTTQIARASRLVSAYTGIPVQPNKAIVGANAFAHEAGIHQDGMLKNPLTYEIMKPETVGLSDSKLVLGKHSGRHAFQSKLEELGYDLEGADLNRVFERFKELCDKKKVVSDPDIEAIVHDEIYQPVELWRLEHIQVSCGSGLRPTATVRLRGPDGVDPGGRRHRHRPGGRGLQGHQPHRPGAERAHRVQHQGGDRGDRRRGRGDDPRGADGRAAGNGYGSGTAKRGRASRSTRRRAIARAGAPTAGTAPTRTSSSPARRPT